MPATLGEEEAAGYWQEVLRVGLALRSLGERTGGAGHAGRQIS